jgi:tetratricopeptide (TPR) repeat protein
MYYSTVLRDPEKARRVYELWIQTYPRDPIPHADLQSLYWQFGQYDKALAEGLKALDLGLHDSMSYGQTAASYLFLDRLEDARRTLEFDEKNSRDYHLHGYNLAFLQNQAAEMAQQVAWSRGKPGIEDMFLFWDSDTLAYYGKLREARERSREATVSAQRAEESETAAVYLGDSALREALFGNKVKAEKSVGSAQGLSKGLETEFESALALAFVGEVTHAQSLADDLGRRFMTDTLVQSNYLPTIRAQIAIDLKEPVKAIEILQTAAPYELGSPPQVAVLTLAMYPVYVRGMAFLDEHKGAEAAIEFRKILDHPGIVYNEPIGPLARVGLARAYAVQGDNAKSRAAYEDFFKLWKDADPDIPILKEAKAEYAKLR